MRMVQHRDESSVSPYTLRARKTKELYMNKDSSEEKELTQSWDKIHGFESQPDAHPVGCRCELPTKKSRRRRRRTVLGNVTNTDEGRLKYDDEIEYAVGNNLYSSSPVGDTSKHAHAKSFGGENVDDISEAKIKAEEFLSSLAAEIMAGDEDNHRPKGVNTHESSVEVDDVPRTELCGSESGSSSWSDTAMEFEPTVIQPALTPGYRLVQCPPFSPEVVSLFGTREVPIINTAAPRRTAYQMMCDSGEYCTEVTRPLSAPYLTDTEEETVMDSDGAVF